MRLIFTSHGLNTNKGTNLIHRTIKNERICEKQIFCVSIPSYGIDELVIKACLRMGFRYENIYMSAKGIPLESDRMSIKEMDYIYVTEGNTFEILDYMRSENLDEYIRQAANSYTTTYIGSSAGAILGGQDVRLALDFDDNDLGITDFTGLGLFDGVVVPHCDSKAMKAYHANKWKKDRKLIRSYRHMYNVGDDDVLVLDSNNLSGMEVVPEMKKNEPVLVIVERRYPLTITSEAYQMICNHDKNILFGWLNNFTEQITLGDKVLLYDVNNPTKYMIAVVWGKFTIRNLEDYSRIKHLGNKKAENDNLTGKPELDIVKYDKKEFNDEKFYIAIAMELY